MTEGQRGSRFGWSARFTVAAVAVAGGAVLSAGLATADPIDPVPTPDPAAVAPGQPVDLPVPAAAPLAETAPPLPAGPPTVPEIANPVYGAGDTPGQFGYLRDLWHASRSGNPLEALTTAPGDAATVGPPAGAGPAPKLPPGYTSITAPESSTPATQKDPSLAPPLPPGYYPLTGPPPPGYFDAPPADPAAPPAPAG